MGDDHEHVISCPLYHAAWPFHPRTAVTAAWEMGTWGFALPAGRDPAKATSPGNLRAEIRTRTAEIRDGGAAAAAKKWSSSGRIRAFQPRRALSAQGVRGRRGALSRQNCGQSAKNDRPSHAQSLSRVIHRVRNGPWAVWLKKSPRPERIRLRVATSNQREIPRGGRAGIELSRKAR